MVEINSKCLQLHHVHEWICMVETQSTKVSGSTIYRSRILNFELICCFPNAIVDTKTK